MNKNKPQTLIEIWGIYLNLRAMPLLGYYSLTYDMIL